MRSVANLSAYLSAVKAPVKMVNARLVIVGQTSAQDVEIKSTDNLVSFSLSQNSYFFSSVATQASAVILKTNWGNLVGKQIKLYFSVKTGSTWEEVCCGTYKVIEQTNDIDKEMTTLKLYDAVAIAQNDLYADNGNLTYPCTVASLTSQVATLYGLTANIEAGLPTTTYTITEDLWETINNTTMRDVLAQIAGATASIIRANSTNATLDLISTSTPTSVQTLTFHEMRHWKIGEKYGQLNTVVLSRQPQEDNVVVKDDTMIERDGIISLKIGNNEILDDDRENLALPILNSVKGMEFYAGEVETIGIGLFEVGDYIIINDGTNNYKMLITELSFEVSGSMKEKIKCVAPKEEDTNYAIAGGIAKTIWNTEIKVDKQNHEITSIVSRMDETDVEVANTFTQVYQDLQNIILNVQSSGSGNLIKNSVGFGKESDGSLTNWQYKEGTTTSNVSSSTSPSSVNAGGVSGHEIQITNGTIYQQVSLTAGKNYTLSVIADKQTSGTGKITIFNGTDSWEINYTQSEILSWAKREKTFTPTENYVIVKIETNTTIQFTDLMLAQGEYSQTWRQASDEIYNKQVSIDGNGVKVASSQYSGDYVQITPTEFAGYSNASGSQKKVFTVNRETTEVEKLKVKSGIDMKPIKIVPVDTASNKGWAFVKSN